MMIMKRTLVKNIMIMRGLGPFARIIYHFLVAKALLVNLWGILPKGEAFTELFGCLSA